MRFLVRVSPAGGPKDAFVNAVKALARSVGCDPRNPKWTSNGALELDIFCPGKADFELFVSTLEPLYRLEFTRDLNIAPPHKEEEELFQEAWLYFNEERYWECHEVLEGIWRTKHGPEKSYLQGLILVCAAYVHHQKGEPGVATSVLRRARAQLDYPNSLYHGVSVKGLAQRVDNMIRSESFETFRV